MFTQNLILEFVSRDFLALKNLWRTASNVPSKMLAWQLHKFGSFENLVREEVEVPVITSPQHLLVEVHATSINPIDLLRLNGYGANLLTNLAKKEGITSDFPLIPCHDVSGKVIATGQSVNKFAVGDEIWGTNALHLPGALAEYVLVKQDEISLKPKSLGHMESASMPYVACTTWAALSKFAELDEKHFRGKKILILGGSGGIGTFACQFAKSLGCHVTATCSCSNMETLRGLKVDDVVDYNTGDFLEQLRSNGKYDIVLDTVGDVGVSSQAKQMLKANMASLYTTLITPFMFNVSKYGLSAGLVASGILYTRDVLKNVAYYQIKTNWTFFTPSALMMKTTRAFVDKKLILPVIEKVYSFEDAKLAFEKMSKKHNKGKTVIQIKN